MLDVDINNDTDNLLNDIAGSFDDILTGNSKTNPFSHIMNITKDISDKYGSKIDNGDIEVEKLMTSISKKVPGMEGFMDKMGGFKGMESVFKNMGPKKKKDKIIINENFSTANVKVEENINEVGMMDNVKIGNVLKMVEGFSSFTPPIMPVSTDDQHDDTQLPPKLPDFTKMLGIFEKLGNAKDENDANDIKADLENFLQNDLGLDKTIMNQQFEDMNKKLGSLSNDNTLCDLMSSTTNNMDKINDLINDVNEQMKNS
jgi:hypothetical protein